MFRHHKHHQHAKPHPSWGWDTSTDDFQVYDTTVYSMPQQVVHHRQEYPKVHRTINYDEEEQRLLHALQTLNEERERDEAARVKKREPDRRVYQEDIDEEADEFIKMEHKKFASRLMSMKTG
ncbi:hypothetical protein SLE2022_378260 [Rubroshorea leprosula]|uniref:Uncharacterized protein n=1 Tax=Rubroshorea leprosula TaxID=152421 RepID=A0AAV5KEI1_9ROSI|nr:hypothetical protein SLEP1_g32795 [Rubroshorea leprosula]